MCKRIKNTLIHLIIYNSSHYQENVILKCGKLNWEALTFKNNNIKYIKNINKKSFSIGVILFPYLLVK